MDDPLTKLAPFITPSRDPRQQAALRIIGAWHAGVVPTAADMEQFPDRMAVVRYLVARLAIPPGEVSALQPSFTALFDLARDEDVTTGQA